MSIFSGPLEPLKQSSGPGLDNNPDTFLAEKDPSLFWRKEKNTVKSSSNHQIPVLCQLRPWEGKPGSGVTNVANKQCKTAFISLTCLINEL